MLDLKNTVKIEIDWQSIKSIELAEIQKANLENDGYTQINSVGGLTTSALIYAKDRAKYFCPVCQQTFKTEKRYHKHIDYGSIRCNKILSRQD